MDMSPEYIKAEEKEITACTRYADAGNGSGRYDVTASFCKHYEQILCVGSAGYEPIRITATHALDVSPVAEHLLRARGWTGKFFLGDCRKLPFPDKAFECGTLSEVVEHLPTGHDVILAVRELDRVCRNWIMSTPTIWQNRPEHKRALTEQDVEFLCRRTGAMSGKYKVWFFIWKGEHGPDF